MEYKPTYWSNKGKYQKQYNIFYKKLVPQSGKAKTTDGELLRCISRFYYEKYNNGFCNDKSYEIAYVNSYRFDDNALQVNKRPISIDEKMNEQLLDETIDAIVEYLLGKKE